MTSLIVHVLANDHNHRRQTITIPQPNNAVTRNSDSSEMFSLIGQRREAKFLMFERDEQQRLSGWDAKMGLRQDSYYLIGTSITLA